ncbi:MAG: M56 family metallopeptidase [Blautia sp.]|jgi:beta-lactamase regulating signal transducer with metallopeptidase domain|uniref:M56 family metallopeptidase n=1 Tax=Blautia sp. TaxID=1955243 RepID=UPI003D8AA8E5
MDNFFLSFISMLFCSSFLAIILHWCRKGGYDTKGTGIICMSIIYLFFFIRMLLPFDIGIGKAIQMPQIFNDIYKLIVLKELSFVTIKFSVADFFVYIWFSIGGYKIIQFINQYCKVIKNIDFSDEINSLQVKDVLYNIEKRFKRKMSISLFESNSVQVPMAVGIIKKRIIIPKREYTDNQIYNILLHEMTHFHNYDLHIKLLGKICCCVFWWNPLSYLIFKDMNQFLEIRCDLSAVRFMSNMEKADYLKTIVSVLQNVNKKNYTPNYSIATLDGGALEKDLLERFTIISKSGDIKRVKNFKIIMIMICFILLNVVSYNFIPVPVYDPPKTSNQANNTKEITPENGYILHGKEGRYYFVEGGKRYEIEKWLAELSVESGFTIMEE